MNQALFYIIRFSCDALVTHGGSKTASHLKNKTFQASKPLKRLNPKVCNKAHCLPHLNDSTFILIAITTVYVIAV